MCKLPLLTEYSANTLTLRRIRPLTHLPIFARINGLIFMPTIEGKSLDLCYNGGHNNETLWR